MVEKLALFVSEHFILVALFVVLVAFFIYTELQRGGKSISPQEVINLINRENALVIDVRSGESFRAGHISGSENLTLEQLDGELARLKALESRPIVVVCDMNNTAGTAGRKLLSAGIEPVYRLSGGLDGWRGASLPLVKG